MGFAVNSHGLSGKFLYIFGLQGVFNRLGYIFAVFGCIVDFDKLL